MKLLMNCLLFLSLSAFGQQATDEDEVDYSSVVGDPYLIKDWSDGVVRFSSGRSMNQFKLKFDCLRNRLELQFQGTVFGAQSQVKEFVLYPGKKKKDSLLFRKGYPALKKLNEETYYEVLFEGKVTLLRLYTRNLVRGNEIVSSGKSSTRMLDVEEFYLYQDGALQQLPDNKEALTRVFTGQEEVISRFINEQELKLKEAKDFIAIVKKYNGLL